MTRGPVVNLGSLRGSCDGWSDTMTKSRRVGSELLGGKVGGGGCPSSAGAPRPPRFHEPGHRPVLASFPAAVGAVLLALGVVGGGRRQLCRRRQGAQAVVVGRAAVSTCARPACCRCRARAPRTAGRWAPTRCTAAPWSPPATGESPGTRTLPRGTTYVTGISCPTVSNCWASALEHRAPLVVATTDGGSTWTTESVPARPANSRASRARRPPIASPPAWGAPVAREHRRGHDRRGCHLEHRDVAHGTYSVTAISCPTASDCWAAGNEGDCPGVMIVTTDGGATWSPQPLPSTVRPDRRPRMPDGFDVLGRRRYGRVTGDVIATTDGG